MWGKERERETSISLIFCLLNFHCVPGSTWGLPGASRCSSASSVHVIANPISSSPKSEGAKIPCALFKIPNEETHPSLLLSHYKVPTKKQKRSSQPTHKQTNKKKFVNKKRAFGHYGADYCYTAHKEIIKKYCTMISHLASLKPIGHAQHGAIIS